MKFNMQGDVQKGVVGLVKKALSVVVVICISLMVFVPCYAAPAQEPQPPQGFKEKVEKMGYNFVKQASFANQGEVYINKGLKTFLSFAYSFQSQYCTIQFFPANKPIVGGICALQHGCLLSKYIEYSKDIEKEK